MKNEEKFCLQKFMKEIKNAWQKNKMKWIKLKNFWSKNNKNPWTSSDGTLVWTYAWNCGVERRGGKNIYDVSIGFKI